MVIYLSISVTEFVRGSKGEVGVGVGCFYILQMG